jgi:hypothetical protein
MHIEATLLCAETGQSPVKSLAPNKSSPTYCSFGGSLTVLTPKLLFCAPA